MTQPTQSNICASIQADVQTRANQLSSELLARVMHDMTKARIKEINLVIGRTHSLEKLSRERGSSDYAEALRQYVVVKRMLGLRRKGVNISLDCATDAECGDLLQQIRAAAEDVRQKRLAAIKLRKLDWNRLRFNESRREEVRFLAKPVTSCGLKYVDGSYCIYTKYHGGLHYNSRVYWAGDWTRADGTSKCFP